ncbi:MAG TPA: hypothetical protein VJZ93_02425 [Candidatus Nanoarchaeia archaeon]|nr:hypothetical protein [Candidatus Nanoarchaeia archaeon]
MKYRIGLDHLSKKREEALSSRNASTYAELCGDLGITGEDMEDIHLAEMALADEAIAKAGGTYGDFVCTIVPPKQKRKSRRRPKPLDYESDDKALEYVARVALMSFNPLERGERLRVEEIKKRMGLLVKIGCSDEKDIPLNYRNMCRGEVWRFLGDFRNKIDLMARERIPEVYDEIQRQNRKWAEQDFYLK